MATRTRKRGPKEQSTALAPVGEALDPSQQGTAMAIAREESEMKAKILLSREFPRDENSARIRIEEACKRKGFAEDALYRFPRGGSEISGPSVKLAKEMTRLWGNIASGQRIVSEDEHKMHVVGYAYDLETNTYFDREAKFGKKIFRKGAGWIVPDERELRELANRQMAICQRNAMLDVMPSDLIELAVRTAEKTMRAPAPRGALTANPRQEAESVIGAFDLLGVTSAQLVKYLGHDLDKVAPDELAKLREIYASIRDGNTTIPDHFELAAGKSGADSVLENIEQQAQDMKEPDKNSQLWSKR